MSLVKNSTIIVLGIMVSNILAYCFHLYVGRALGPTDYGIFGALMSLFLIIALPAGAISSAIAKFSSRFKLKQEYGKIGALRRMVQDKVIIFGIIIFFLITILSKFISDYLKIGSNFSVMLIGLILIFALILPVNRGILQGMKKFKEYSLNSIIESVSRLILVIILIYLGFGVNGAILAYGIAYLIAFLLIFRQIKETGKYQDHKKAINMKIVLKFILLVLLANLFLQMLINAPTLFIKHYFSSEFTGFWTASLTLARISLFIATAIALVMFPEISGNDNPKERKIIFLKSLGLTLIATTGIALVFLLFGKFAINILYGSAYLPSLPILQWMGIVMILIGALQLIMNYFLAICNH